ncbi:MAG: oligosaccharide flippase family protein, partial [Nanoarchaeota archaeon]
MYFNSKKFVKTSIKCDFVVWKEFISRGIPLALTSFFYFTYFKIDIIILSIMLNDQVVGWYSASYRLLELFLFVPYILSYSVFPSIFRFHEVNKEVSNQIFSRTSKLLIVLSIPILLGVFSLAPEIINLVYGAEFIQSVLPLRIIILSLPFIFLHQLFRFIFYSSNKEVPYLF